MILILDSSQNMTQNSMEPREREGRQEIQDFEFMIRDFLRVLRAVAVKIFFRSGFALILAIK
jgi:hypothetical protein